MTTKKNQPEYITYRMLSNTLPFFFSGYTDRKGFTQELLSNRKDKYGNLIREIVRFDDITIQVHNTDKKRITFIDNSPFCEGSPNCTGKPVFRRMDVQADTKANVEDKELKAQAMSAAYGLEGERLQEIAVMCGTTNEDPTFQKEKVYGFAENNPGDFLELFKTEAQIDIKIRSFLRRIINSGIVKQKKGMFIWEEVNLGFNEDEAVSYLTKDKEVYEAIKEAHRKLMTSNV